MADDDCKEKIIRSIAHRLVLFFCKIILNSEIKFTRKYIIIPKDIKRPNLQIKEP